MSCCYNTNFNAYSGTAIQPDSLNFFIKSDKKATFSSNVPLCNYVGYMPIVSMFTGTARIVQSVKHIFTELSNLNKNKTNQHSSELYNGFKNLSRGIVEVIPLTGIFLLIFDMVKANKYCKEIEKEIEDKSNVGGIAINNKITIFYDLAKIDKIVNRLNSDKSDLKKGTDSYRLEALQVICREYIKVVEEKKQKNQTIEMSRTLSLIENFLADKR